MKSDNLPSWEECCKAVDDESATPLQEFIHDNEPTTDEADEWRDKLAKVLSFEHARILQDL